MTKDIALICDDNYCLPTAVCIQSIKDNYNLNDTLLVHVCTFGLRDENVLKLNSMGGGRVEVSIEVFKEEDYEDLLQLISQKSHVTPTALIKFELPNYFSNLKSILYLDSDLIIKSDISELLKIDVDSYILAASYDFNQHLNRLRYTLMRGPDKVFYFNSGVMLLNLQRMREEHITSQLWDYKIYHAKSWLMDQESFNAVCGDYVFHLPIRWNFNPMYFEQQYIKQINVVYDTDYINTQDLENDVRIIHFVGARDKPWKFENARMRSYWEYYFTLTPYNCELNLNQYTPERRPFLEAISGRIKEHGVWGTICYMIYCIEKKIGKNV